MNCWTLGLASYAAAIAPMCDAEREIERTHFESNEAYHAARAAWIESITECGAACEPDESAAVEAGQECFDGCDDLDDFDAKADCQYACDLQYLRDVQDGRVNRGPCLAACCSEDPTHLSPCIAGCPSASMAAGPSVEIAFRECAAGCVWFYSGTFPDGHWVYDEGPSCDDACRVTAAIAIWEAEPRQHLCEFDCYAAFYEGLGTCHQYNRCYRKALMDKDAAYLDCNTTFLTVDPVDAAAANACFRDADNAYAFAMIDCCFLQKGNNSYDKEALACFQASVACSDAITAECPPVSYETGPCGSDEFSEECIELVAEYEACVAAATEGCDTALADCRGDIEAPAPGCDKGCYP